jgi:hypothetical protein
MSDSGATEWAETAFVPGEPVLFMGRSEAVWKKRVQDAVVGKLSRPRLEFTVASFLRNGNRFDLDNLAKPVLAVVAPDAQSIWVKVRQGSEPGVHISEAAPPPPVAVERRVSIPQPPTRSKKRVETIPELVGANQIGQDEPLGIYLAFSGDDVAVSDCGFEGPIKPLIDSMWPILGGKAGSPADHRIRELRVVRAGSGRLGVDVSVWFL